MPLHLSTAQPDFAERFAALLSMKREDAADVNEAVAAIIADVRARGDAALVELTTRFDRLSLEGSGALHRQGRVTSSGRAMSRRGGGHPWLV